jgi:hypothetical protein
MASYTAQDLIQEISVELGEFVSESSDFPNLSNIQKADYVDLLASQKFTMINEVAREIPNSGDLMKALGSGPIDHPLAA